LCLHLCQICVFVHLINRRNWKGCKTLKLRCKNHMNEVVKTKRGNHNSLNVHKKKMQKKLWVLDLVSQKFWPWICYEEMNMGFRSGSLNSFDLVWVDLKFEQDVDEDMNYHDALIHMFFFCCCLWCCCFVNLYYMMIWFGPSDVWRYMVSEAPYNSDVALTKSALLSDWPK
jgi:hypothetical protein